MRTDGRTDRHDEVNSRFSQFLRMSLKRQNIWHLGSLNKELKLRNKTIVLSPKILKNLGKTLMS
jgi:hypothetical protein